MSTFYSAAPVVSSGQMKLWSGVHIPGIGYRQVDFDLEVFWLRQGELKLEFMHGGLCVKEGSTFNDFYGFLNCVRCVEDAQAWAKKFSVDAASTAEVIATLTVFDSPAIVDAQPESIEHNRRAEAENLKRKWGYLDEKLREQYLEDGEPRYRRLDRRELAQRVIWSSKKPAVDIEGLVMDLRQEFEPKVDAVTC